jgi:hypothetical protein
MDFKIYNSEKQKEIIQKIIDYYAVTINRFKENLSNAMDKIKDNELISYSLNKHGLTFYKHNPIDGSRETHSIIPFMDLYNEMVDINNLIEKCFEAKKEEKIIEIDLKDELKNNKPIDLTDNDRNHIETQKAIVKELLD